MKCDELKPVFVDMSGNIVANELGELYYKPEVDAAIAELKAENERLKATPEQIMKEVFDKVLIYPKEMVRLDDAYKLSVALRATRRALWLARANRALEKIAWFKLWNASISTMNPEDGARREFDKWKRNLGKFLKKVEEYK